MRTLCLSMPLHDSVSSMGGLDILIQGCFTFYADCIRVGYTALGWVNFLQTLAHQLGPSLVYLGFTCALVSSTVCPLVWRSVAPLIYLCGCALVSPLRIWANRWLLCRRRIGLYGGPHNGLADSLSSSSAHWVAWRSAHGSARSLACPSVSACP